MLYSVKIHKTADAEIKAVLRYISEDLLNPLAAEKLRTKMYERIFNLAHMPERFPVYGDSNYRKTHVAKYTIFYTVDKQKHEVYIARAIYSGRDFGRLI